MRVYGVDLLDFWRGDISLRRLNTLLQHLPAGSATHQALDIETAWTVQEHLAADQVDATAILLWFKTKDGEKGRNRPTPVPRPGRVPEVEHDTKKYGSGAIPVDEFDEWLRQHDELAALRDDDGSEPVDPD